jgi:dTDP-4-amino-4,6-dideoxygalactose transaminase
LSAKLPWLRAWTERRRQLAAGYRAALAGSVLDALPECDAGHVYHLFVARTASRDELQAHLAGNGIETFIHYPVPIPQQPAFADSIHTECPVASRACQEIVSLPLYPRMTLDDVAEVATAVNESRIERKPCEP